MNKRLSRSVLWLTLMTGGIVLSVFSSPRAPLVVVCAGDSIMRPVPAHFRTLAPGEGLDLDIREWAQGGLDSKTYLDFFRRNLEGWAGTKADAILLQLGTNDALPLAEGKRTPEEFRAGMIAILAEFQKFREPGARRPVLLLATVPYFCDRPESAAKNKMVDVVINPALKEIAAAEGAILVDQYSILKNRPDYYDPDCVHPNAAGEIALARNWLRALRASLDTYLRGERPKGRS